MSEEKLKQIKEELKQIKIPHMSCLTPFEESIKRVDVGAMVTPNLEGLVDPKTKMMAHIVQNTTEMKENSKNPFWKNLLIAVIGGIVGGAVPYLLVLIFG